MRSDGFDRMDVSTSLPDDPKFRALARRHPEQLATAGWAYVGLLAMSWREGERLTLEEGWPAFLPWDQEAADAMLRVGLVDGEWRLPERPWQAWYVAAAERRRLGRERQHRADVKRGRSGKNDSQSGSSGSTGSSGGQAEPSVSQSGPPPDQRGSNVGRRNDPVQLVPDEGPCRICGGHVRAIDDGAVVGPGWIAHNVHPDDYQAATA